MKSIQLFLLLMLVSSAAFCQSLITMSNKCYKMVQAGNAANDSQQYDEALTTFEKVLSKCSAKDAKEQGNVGKAKALNGLKRYDEAIQAADLAIKASKNTSIAALFEKADAHFNQNNLTAATDDYNAIIALSEKNQNTKDRATIYSKLADLDWKQKKSTEAYQDIDKAIALDPANPAYLIQKGDFKVKEGALKAGFEYYDKALETTSDKPSVYKLRAIAFTNAMQGKHSTRDAKELATRMSAEEKKQFCEEWKRLFDTGYKNVNQDLYYTMICL
ncbi:tetratricopeptide repeat protein [Flavihumibacter petaseus]|uniref:Uncharacterized protein n=1 Tax=Flavihumibacter petaseus NBRC 106054 TaxID=1220578 RepID=A0A0E9MX48_9BACT|nr:tetratricopeptide repeat protein [Flavihumibacter petaseus]GAO42078.1 hypothetical protein FPE01S_01_10910 [Flavihumibacter petaseus NBRC 106054]